MTPSIREVRCACLRPLLASPPRYPEPRFGYLSERRQAYLAVDDAAPVMVDTRRLRPDATT
jgi:hypothetical protein